MQYGANKLKNAFALICDICLNNLQRTIREGQCQGSFQTKKKEKELSIDQDDYNALQNMNEGSALIISIIYFYIILFLNVTFNFFTVNFSGSGPGAFVSSRSEPISLSTLDQDCFIIPVRSLERFLPAGLPVTFNMSTQKKLKLIVLKASSILAGNKRSELQTEFIICARSFRSKDFHTSTFNESIR